MIELVRGMRDMLPGDYALQAAIAENIEQVLASYGYVSVDAPILERRELYLRKLGEELVGKIYEFSFNGRDLALRPEWTASVLRSYVARMQAEPLPLRLRYTGPVFRNERPQRHTFRQFTQLGVELIGGPTPRADAECLALACAGLDAVNVQDYRVRILNPETATQATTRVLIESSDGRERWGTVGVSENIIEASWEALVDSMEYKLFLDEQRRQKRQRK